MTKTQGGRRVSKRGIGGEKRRRPGRGPHDLAGPGEDLRWTVAAAGDSNTPVNRPLSCPAAGSTGSTPVGRKGGGAAGWRRMLALLGLGLLGSLDAAAAEPTPRTVRVVVDDNYPPYAFRDAAGKLQGITVDQWARWERQTGLKAELHAMDWAEALRRMRAGEFDAIDSVFLTDERRRDWDFTPPYARIEVAIFFREEISGIADLDSLRGFAVAAKEGDAAIELLRAHGVTTIQSFRNYEAVIEAARQHKINVFVVDAPPALYFLNKAGIAGAFRRSAPVNVGAFHRAVRKGNRALLAAVSGGFAAIDPAELRAIDEKWFGTKPGGSNARVLRYVGYGAAAALLAIAALGGWSLALRRRVERRTAALAESEARFRQVVENIQEVFWLRDRATDRIVYVSPSYEKVWGRSCGSLYASRGSWQNSLHPDDVERVGAAAARQGEGGFDETYRIIRPDGTVRWVRDLAYPVIDAAGRLTRVVGVAEDITERRQLEQRFLQTQRMEAVGSLASGLAHDLNNILAPVLLSSGLLKMSVRDPRDLELVALIERGTKRGAEIVKQLLIYSRGSEGVRVPVQMRHVMAEIASIMRETFPRGIRIVTSTASGLPLVLADATQLHQVLLNLCVNARDAMPEGGTLTLRAQAVEIDAGGARLHPAGQPGAFVNVTVQDTGHGIDRIFEPFFSTKAVGYGSGLGLSTALGIVKSLGGWMAVASEAGRGSTFAVYLPVMTGTATGAGGASGAGATAESATPWLSGKGELILVVDDEEAVRESTGRLLERAGYQVLTAASGAEALALLRAPQHAVRVLVTDLMMPEMDGCAVVRAARELRPGLPIIAVSGYVADEKRAELARRGVRDVLAKPYSVSGLLDAVARALRPAE